MRQIGIAFIALTLLTAGACGASISDEGRQPATLAESPTSSRQMNKAAAPPEPAADAVKPVSLQEADQARTATEAFNRKIIRNAEIELRVDDPVAAQQKISSAAEGNGGFVVTSEIVQRGSAGATVTITMRVPADRFGQAVEAVRASGDEILREKITGQDVTEEFIDLEARLKTKRALEEQFLEIMKEARTVEDALNVQRQIAGVRGEIEQIEGRRRYLENQASLSTITVTLRTTAPIVTSTKAGFMDHIRRAFGDAIDTGSAIITGFIYLIAYLIPITLLILLPGFLLLRFLIRRLIRASRERAEAQPAPATPPQV